MADTQTLGTLLIRLALGGDAEVAKRLNLLERQVMGTGSSMKRFGDTIQGGVVVALKAATVALGAFATASVVFGAGFESQMRRVQAISGATGAEYDALTEKARQLGRDTLYTATEAATAMQALAQAGLSTRQIIEVSDSALKLAGTTGTSIDEAANLIVATMRQFGLSATDSTRIIDVFSKSIRTSLLDFSSLREAMKYAGSAGAAFGMTLEETVAGVAAFRDLGLEGSLAGNAFKMSMLQATQATEQNRAILAKYSLKMEDVNAETHNFAEIVNVVGKAGITATDALVLFGARAGASVAALGQAVRDGKLDMEAYTETLVQSAGQTEEMYATILDSTKSQATIVMSALQDLLIESFNLVGPGAKELLKEVTATLNLVTASLAANAGEIRWRFTWALARVQEWLRANGPNMAANFVAAAQAASKVAAAVANMLPYLKTAAVLVVDVFLVSRILSFANAVGGVISALRMLVLQYRAVGMAATASSGASIAALGAVGVAVAALSMAFLYFDNAAAEAEARANRTVKQQIKDQEALVGGLAEQEKANRAAMQAEEDRWAKEGLKNESRKWYHDQRMADLNSEADALEQEAGNAELWLSKLRQRSQVEEADAVNRKRAADAATRAEEELQVTLAALDEELAEAERNAKAAGAAMGGAGEDTEALAKATEEAIRQADAEVDRLLKLAAAASDVHLAMQQFAAETEMLDVVPDAFSPAALQGLRDTATLVDEVVGPVEDTRTALERLLDVQSRLGEFASRWPQVAGTDAFKEMEARVRNAIQAEQDQGSMMDRLREKWAQVKDAATTAFSAPVRVAKAALTTLWNSLKSLYSGIKGLFSSLLDMLQLNPAELAQVAGGTQQEGATVTSGVQAGEDAAANAVAFVQGIINELPALVNALVAALPGLLAKVVQAIPVIVDTIISALPQVVDALLDALPDVVQRIAQAIPELVDTIVQELPRIVGGLLDALDTIIPALLEAIPLLVDALVAELPGLIASIVRWLPEIIKVLLSAVGDLIVAIVEELPTLIEGILQALPGIIDKLAQVIGPIITAILHAIPQIIIALVRGIPDIIGAIVSLIGEIVIALVDGIITEIIPMLPTIVWEIIKAIVHLAGEIVVALWGIVKKLVQKTFEWISDAFEGVAEFFGFGDTPGPVKAGEGGMYARFAPGDYVVASQSVQGLLAQVANLPSAMGAAVAGAMPPMAAAGAGGGGFQARVQVVAEGRVLQDVLFDAAASGRAPGMRRVLRASRGVRTGIDTGRFNRRGA